MLRSFKDLLKHRFPGVVSAFHEYLSAREQQKYYLKDTPYGFRLMGHAAMQNGTFEEEEVALVREHLASSEVFVDVGANIGLFTCLALSMNKKVISVEPLFQNLTCLYPNLQANGWTDVEVYPVGLAERPGISTLYGGGTGASLLPKWAGTSEVWHRPIPLSTMDILLGNRFAGRKIMIKIDVEGTEFEVLQGSVNTLSMSPPPVWLVEICLTEHHPGGNHPHFSDVFNIFWSHGYEASVADGNRRCVSPSDVERWVRNRKKDFGFINYIFKK